MFYNYRQNNSGSTWSYDDKKGISVNVIVEAASAEEAAARAEEIGLYWNGMDADTDCECCGDRWSMNCEEEGDSIPQVYGVPVHFLTVANFDYGRKWLVDKYECFVHYSDGRIEGFWK